MDKYYSNDWVYLYHGKAEDYLPTLGDESVDCVITDPPYTERVHKNAFTKNIRSNLGQYGVEQFDHMTDEHLYAMFTEMGRVTRGWVVATIDYRQAIAMDNNPPPGLKCQRVGVWVKEPTIPQITGDRPAQGWEAIAYLHRTEGRSKWNGGGHHGNYVMRAAQNLGHPTSKPLPMIEDLVRKFTNPGDLILDPYAGSGTTLLAAMNERRHAIGVECDEAYCELIAKRLSRQTATLF